MPTPSTESMPLLIVEAVQISLSRDVLDSVMGELKAGGLVTGMFYVGGITAIPDMVYLLWHLAGEVPVTCIIPRKWIESPGAARNAIQEFLLKWNQRIG